MDHSRSMLQNVRKWLRYVQPFHESMHKTPQDVSSHPPPPHSPLSDSRFVQDCCSRFLLAVIFFLEGGGGEKYNARTRNS